MKYFPPQSTNYVFHNRRNNNRATEFKYIIRGSVYLTFLHDCSLKALYFKHCS